MANKEKKAIENNDEIEQRLNKYFALFDTYGNKKVISDLKTGLKKESIIYKKYPKEKVMKLLENPQLNEKSLRELSRYLYITSSNYQRLNDYYANILLYNYYLTPIDMKNSDKIEEIRKSYFDIANLLENYNLKDEAEKCIKIAVRDGVFCGICYETEKSFCIKQFNADYTIISSITDGCFIFSIDLEYFKSRESILSNYPSDVQNAYNLYKERNVEREFFRFYEPKDGICIKADPTDESFSIPLLTGLVASVYDIEEYGIIQKTKSRNDIYKAIVMQMDVDENGIPKMSEEMASRYFGQADGNIADNVGLIMTPFKINEVSFSSNSSSDRNAVTDAENEFWYKAGVSPLIFGSQKGASQGSLLLSVKPDETIAYFLLLQFQRYINMRLKKKKLKYNFKLKFLLQSIFNQDEEANRHKNAAIYGIDGSKIKYAAAVGQTPADVINLGFLETDILEIGTKRFIRPLISSNTLSNGQIEAVETDTSNGGRPTNDSKGEGLTDEGEKSREKK